jgi:hypothetical protein
LASKPIVWFNAARTHRFIARRQVWLNRQQLNYRLACDLRLADVTESFSPLTVAERRRPYQLSVCIAMTAVFVIAQEWTSAADNSVGL